MTTYAPDIAATVLVVFGTTGDLMARKIVPSLFYLRGSGQLPQRLCVLGFGRRDWDDARLRQHVREIVAEKAPKASSADVEVFLTLFRYQRGEFDDAASYGDAHARRCDSGRVGGLREQALLPGGAARALRDHLPAPVGERADRGLQRFGGVDEGLVEKPFGDDLKTARELDSLLGSLFREEQIYRIDHYLAKEMLQGIMNFRFTNNLFESEWGRRAIERIDVTLLESIGAEKRGAFYDSVGALRDVGQNHLLQMLALVTMEHPPR